MEADVALIRAGPETGLAPAQGRVIVAVSVTSPVTFIGAGQVVLGDKDFAGKYFERLITEDHDALCLPATELPGRVPVCNPLSPGSSLLQSPNPACGGHGNSKVDSHCYEHWDHFLRV